MKKILTVAVVILLAMVMWSFMGKQKVTTVYLIGDSTMADYSDNYDPGKDYYESRYPMTGWGQVFQAFMSSDSLAQVRQLIKTDSVVVDDRARGGRSTRTFFQEGRWRSVYESLQPGDLVLMQFGHNDAAEKKTERYVNVEGYKEFLRLYVLQTRQKEAIPIILTPVNRNYPWDGDQMSSCHGEYELAAESIAEEMDVMLIDLTQRSIDQFVKVGRDYATTNYFMNIPAEKYQAYPDGLSDNTHFQPEGAVAVAQCVFDGMKELNFKP